MFVINPYIYRLQNRVSHTFQLDECICCYLHIFSIVAFNNLIHVRGDRGVVTSPKTMAACGVDRECSWLIGVKRSSQIKIQFSRISLPKCSTPCGCNYIEVRDGINSSGRLIAKFCETIEKPENICTTSNHLWIKYKYGLDLSHYGFRAAYQRWQCRKKNTQTAVQSTTAGKSFL